jgi:hypothetical protein
MMNMSPETAGLFFCAIDSDTFGFDAANSARIRRRNKITHDKN